MKNLIQQIRSYVARQILALHLWLSVETKEATDYSDAIVDSADEFVAPGLPLKEATFIMCVGVNDVKTGGSKYYYVKTPSESPMPDNTVLIVNGEVFDPVKLGVTPIVGRKAAEERKNQLIELGVYTSVYYFESPNF